jgi:hypothetical protein
MSKKYKNKVCVYCAAKASETADHVVAKEFFPRTHRDGLPKAPACKPCNATKAALEHTFTAVLPFGSEHPVARQMLMERAGARLDKNPQLRQTLQRGGQPILVQRKGQVLPSITLPFEGDEFVRLCGYIIRGLVWYEWKHVVPVDYYVEAIPVSDVGLVFFRDWLLQMSQAYQRTGNFAGGAFQYACTRKSDDPAFSVWHIRLYESLNLAGDDTAGGLARVHICGVTGPTEVKEIMDKFKRLDQGRRAT